MQIFHRSTNTIAKVSIFGAVAFLAVLLWLWSALLRSAYATGQGVVQKQPVPFSHDHHVAGLGIDCRYCHTAVEKSAFAGLPPTETCMNCHRQIWTNAELLEPVRESYRSGKPIAWNRVNDLPDFVYFNHAIHVAKGVGCSECHGQVDEMPLMRQTASLQMEWCLECHREPGKRLRPREEVFNMKWRPPANAAALQARLVREYDVKSLTSCSVCHR
ncbi:MAG TPA: cytochrome c3 family protein [Thermoanaerobaculia bacterium]|nr:cytochrome c3 family protein [Thermoanaerobaculia bacterium]